MSSHQEGHEITSITWGTTMSSHQEGHGIMSITWGETSSPERDCSSHKGEVSRMSYNQAKTQQALTSYRLGETLSFERDASSFKTKTIHLSESSSRNQGKVMIFLPRRDKLTWARIPVLTTVHTCINHTFNPKQHIKVFQATTTTYKSYEHKIKLKWVEYSKNMWTLASLTWTYAIGKHKHSTEGYHNSWNKVTSWKC